MNTHIDNLNSVRKPKIFNQSMSFVEGWYWVLPSQSLQIGEIKAVTIFGKDLVVYRGKDRRAVILDAYCPHMGTSLAEGKIEGNELRCVLHRWKFDAEGICVDIPNVDEPVSLKAKTWPAAEQYGMIWVWTGETPQQPLPFVLDWENQDFDFSLGSQFSIDCHPNVLLLQGIDTQQINLVNKLPLKMVLEKQELNQNAIIFSTITNINGKSFWLNLYQRFFNNSFNYSVCYWYGTTSIVSFTNDSTQLHIIFTTRLLPGGKTAGQTLFMSKKRQGILGKLINKLILKIGKKISDRLLKTNDKILETMQFDLKTPLKADLSIIQFINHLERQKPLTWESWLLVRSREREEEVREEREKREKWRDELVND
ncbi:MAG: aromatic ring-hydroxylating dioxygenase subunit alpha [Dolichospermum sp. DL01]|nr:MAG: aromatic ring-hydroxylating dioxygenase subunit alpha [Dolichospermum sp. DL01]